MAPRPPTPSTIPSKLTVNFVLSYNSVLSGKEWTKFYSSFGGQKKSRVRLIVVAFTNTPKFRKVKAEGGTVITEYLETKRDRWLNNYSQSGDRWRAVAALEIGGVRPLTWYGDCRKAAALRTGNLVTEFEHGLNSTQILHGNVQRETPLSFGRMAMARLHRAIAGCPD
ncbi:ATP synthase subunit delta' [Striga asiatica]|uniref:ATP synthase subunit delta n=1 Tax=Striga asiatica TaxID=4170 RepID=A0A5A7QKX1_STRAF|nr:ATP synthase subunit delta' [Striga asiatica]